MENAAPIYKSEPSLFVTCDECDEEYLVELDKPDNACGACGLPYPYQVSPSADFVSVYLVTRHYGGPQEGGWWYNNRTLQHCVAVPTAEAVEVAKELAEGKYSNEGRRSIYSMAGNSGEFEVYIGKLVPPACISGHTTYE